MADKLIIANASSSRLGASFPFCRRAAKSRCVRSLSAAHARAQASWRREQVAPAFERDEKMPKRNKRGWAGRGRRGKFNWTFVLFERCRGIKSRYSAGPGAPRRDEDVVVGVRDSIARLRASATLAAGSTRHVPRATEYQLTRTVSSFLR